MTKRKTSIMVDQEVWKKWTHFVIDKTGSARKLSAELENALTHYMQKKSPDKWLEEEKKGGESDE